MKHGIRTAAIVCGALLASASVYAQGGITGTKDEDYNNLSVVRGSPPKVMWLQLGNCATAQVEAVFRARFADIEAFEKDSSVGTLVLS